jgi:hypothetical protein
MVFIYSGLIFLYSPKSKKHNAFLSENLPIVFIFRSKNKNILYTF